MPRNVKQGKARRPVGIKMQMVVWHIPFALIVLIGMFYLFAINNRQDTQIKSQSKEITQLKKSVSSTREDFDTWGSKSSNIVVVTTTNGELVYNAYVAYDGANPDTSELSFDSLPSYLGWYLTKDKSKAFVFKWEDSDFANHVAKHFYGKLQKIKEGN